MSVPIAPARPTLPARQSTGLQRVLTGATTPGGGVFVLVGVLLIAVVVANPTFGDPGSLIRFIGRTAPIAIAAVGQYFVIVSGEFDLSMAAVITAQVVMAGNLIGQDPSRILPVTIAMFALGAFIGLINGVATTILKVPSIIVTLGMMLALSGFVRYLTGGAATGNPVDSFRQIGRGGITGVPVVGIIPYSALILVAIAIAAVALMRRPFGRTLIAAGDNAAAAELSGARLWWLKTRAFMLSSLAATVSGILLVGYAGVHPSVGQGYEFAAITAVVIGGVVLGGGRGWVLSAVAGAFAVELLLTLLTFLGVTSTWRPTIQGVIIIAAVAFAARAWRARKRPDRPTDATQEADISDSPEGPELDAPSPSSEKTRPPTSSGPTTGETP